jgi:hypothetical protein
MEQQHARRITAVEGANAILLRKHRLPAHDLLGDRLRAGFEAVRDAAWSAFCRNPGIPGDWNTGWVTG